MVGCHSYPQACLDFDLNVLDIEGRLHGSKHQFGKPEKIALIANPGIDDGEFVPAKACYLAADAGEDILQPLGKLDQKEIAGMMAKSIINLLEAIQIKHEQRNLPMILQHSKMHLQFLFEIKAVWKTGQRIMISLVFERCELSFLVGNVSPGSPETTNLAVFDNSNQCRGYPDFVPIAVILADFIVVQRVAAFDKFFQNILHLIEIVKLPGTPADNL